jgi:SLOG family YspA-like protein
MKVLCCGDRAWANVAVMARTLDLLAPGDVVIHGDAPGADRMAGALAAARGHEVIPIAADWDRYGRSAGPVRNRAMLRLHPDVQLVLAFHDHIRDSKGTADMIAVALNAGIVVNVVSVLGVTIVLPPQPKLI